MREPADWGGSRGRVRPLLLVLLLVWAGLIFMVLDLFLNVDEFDGIRPRSGLYAGMRKAAHDMVGEPLGEDPENTWQPGALRAARAEGVRGPRSIQQMAEDAKRLEASVGRRAPRALPQGTDTMVSRHGMYAEWTNPGGQIGEGEYEKGQRHGIWTWYWTPSVKREQRQYKDGILDGDVKSWYEDGVRQSEEHWKDGKPVGTWKWWHPNGTLGAIDGYQDGMLHGTSERWHANGKKAAEVTYDRGTPYGKATFWHEDGSKAEEGSFAGGARHGVWTQWDANGVPREETYEAGRRTG